jgi:2-polyprenyl-3-methyl-5-hydroxy-6-metoxy-1,4-benzoquinol methylase
VIAGYCQFLNPAARVLDVGCGTGLLAQRLAQDTMSTYVGIDLSPVAIERARRLDLEKAEFIVGNAATFEPPQAFDLIIFNEILYYLMRPEEHAQRYARHLVPGGHLIVSMWYCAGGLRTWTRLDRRFYTLDRVRITHPLSRKRFDVAILKLRS